MFVGVLIAYILPWLGVKELITSACLWACDLFSVAAIPLSSTSFALKGIAFEINTGCTMWDVALGAIALLWCRERTWLWNSAMILVFTAGLMLLNIARLTLGFVAFEKGVSWFWSHEVVAGIVYWTILETLCEWRLYHDTRGPTTDNLAPSTAHNETSTTGPS